MLSPSFTYQATISASSRPSPRSGRLNWRMRESRSTRLAGAARGGDDAANRRHVLLLKAGKRHERIVTSDTHDRREQGQETTFRDQSRDFGAEPSGPSGLVHDHAAAGLRD